MMVPVLGFRAHFRNMMGLPQVRQVYMALGIVFFWSPRHYFLTKAILELGSVVLQRLPSALRDSFNVGLKVFMRN